MGTARADADANPTPSPVPASEVRPAADAAIKRGLARTDLEGARMAEEMYGDDEDGEIAALVAGTHPFQRGLGGDGLVASRREAAQLLAARR